jgi:hypothetical protein
LLLSNRSEELIAAGGAIAFGLSPFSLMFSVFAFLGSTFFSFYPEPYFLPMAISLLTLSASTVWIVVSGFRIGKVNWGIFVAAGVTFLHGYLRSEGNEFLKRRGTPGRDWKYEG